MTFLLYLCKVFLCSGILLGYYWLFLRNKQFHRYNRFYLLGAMITSMVLPFFKIRIWDQPQNPVNQVVYRTVDVLTVGYGETDGQLPVNTPVADLFTVDLLLYIVYSAGTLALLMLLAKSLLHIRRIARQYPYEVIDRLKFYTTSEPGTPFSFFRSIFWNDQLSFNSKEGQQIFRHELFHIRQRHSTDVLLAELITALFWCNPFFHILKKELKAIHEFLADQYAVSGSDRYTYAELLVMQTLHARHIPLTHRFFQNHIKRRIAMITHLNNTRHTYWRRMMVLPLAIVLFCGFTLYTNKSASSFKNTGDNKIINVVIDAGHGGIDNGAVSPDGKALEKDLALQISQKIQQLAPDYNVNVIMTRTGDALPSGANNIEDGLRARLTIAEQNKADLYVAIHVSANGKEFDNNKGGFELFIGTTEKIIPAATQLGSAILQSLGTLYATNPVIKQRKEKGIYVLNRSHCPSVLIECGYITNSNDLEFIGKTSNQEAVAKKILEGIVAYKKMQPEATANVQSSLLQDPDVLRMLTRHFNRNFRYPQKALRNMLDGEVYFSVDLDKNATLGNFQLYNEAPSAADKIHPLVIVAYPDKTAQPLPITQEEKDTIFKQEVKRAAESKNDMAELTKATPGRYYFKAKFVVQKEA